MDFRVSVLPDAVRREDRPAAPRQAQPAARHDQARLRAEAARGLQGGHPPALRHGAGHRPDRLGQDDDALLGALASSTRSTRNITTAEDPVEYNLARHQPGADARRDRPELRGGAALASCGRTRTSSWSARSATSRPRRSRSRPRSPATWCSRRCTPTTRPSTISRLLNMGVEPFLVTASRQPDPRAAPRRASCARTASSRSSVDAQALLDLGVPPEQDRHLPRCSRGPAAAPATTAATRAASRSTRSCASPTA